MLIVTSFCLIAHWNGFLIGLPLEKQIQGSGSFLVGLYLSHGSFWLIEHPEKYLNAHCFLFLKFYHESREK